MVGLALSYALSVTGRLSGVITSFTETEKQMVAVERQVYYINNVPQVIQQKYYFFLEQILTKILTSGKNSAIW